ncbi:Trm112 family protein [Pseudooceanicola sp. LIPI14-2-Ac024]|uniref:Trm112 family protein n=1 Tax=Pseudooceanicola sp. LIPI14-2-Ac024 TaxID=3344875 RepID=UPI0035CFCD49
MTDVPQPPVPQAPVPEAEPAFDRRMLEALVCPETHATLRYDAEANELISDTAGLAYPIRNGIPIMLVDEARRLDA